MPKITRELVRQWTQQYDGLTTCAREERVHRSTLRSACTRYQLFFPSQKEFRNENEYDPDQEAAKMEQQAARRAQRREEVIATRQTYIAHVIQEAIGDGINYRPPPAYKSHEYERDSETAVCPIFDPHAGEEVTGRDSLGLEYYNFDVFLERLARHEKAIHTFIELKGQLHPIDEIIIAYGGDMVEGHGIFPGQDRYVDMGAGEAAIRGAEAYAGFEIRLRDHLAKFSQGTPRIRCYHVIGNHGRPGGRKGGAGLPPDTNWDYILYSTKAMLTKQYPEIENHLPKPGLKNTQDYYYVWFSVYGWKFFLTHGDDIAYWGRTPYYGMENATDKWIKVFGFIPDEVLMGHLHTDTKLTLGSHRNLTVSGSYVMANTYTKRIKKADIPSQVMFWVHPKNYITGRHQIWLKDIKEE